MSTEPGQAVKSESHEASKKIEPFHGGCLLKESPSKNPISSNFTSSWYPSDGPARFLGIIRLGNDWQQQYESIPADFSSFEKVIEALKLCGFTESAKYIAYLHSGDDLEEGDKPLTLESAIGFVTLMQNFRDLGEPMIGLFSKGTISAEWRIANDKHLLIEPLDADKASFAFIGPSNEPGKQFRLNGRGTIMEIISTLRKHGVDQWKSA